LLRGLYDGGFVCHIFACNRFNFLQLASGGNGFCWFWNSAEFADVVASCNGYFKNQLVRNIMIAWERNLNALVVIILSGVLLGAYGVQIFMHEQPCPLCLLQRLGMIGVAVGALLNIWFGVHMSHYGLSLLSALMGGLVALRQISLHVCPGFGEFGLPVLGLSLYTWSFIVFVCVVLSVALLLFLYDPAERQELSIRLNGWCKLAFSLMFFVALANIITTLIQCGLGPCADV